MMYPRFYDFIAPQSLAFDDGRPYRSVKARAWYSLGDGPGSALYLDTPRGMFCAFFSNCGNARIEDLRL
jgi:hypothetical protein